MPTLAAASWSFRPRGPRELVEQLRAAGLGAVQLHLDPVRSGAWDERDTVEALATGEVEIVSGMMSMAGEDYSTIESIRRTGGLRPTERWRENLQAAHGNAALAQRLGLELVTFHAGFIPEEPGAERAEIIERLTIMRRVFGECGVTIGLETGQESPEVLLAAIDEAHALVWDERSGLGGAPEIGVNFDPANMILYGSGDPLGAVRRLRARVVQVHLKDARASGRAEDWGEEVAVGEGEVPWEPFLRACLGLSRVDAWVIEREAGEARVTDIAKAAGVVRELWKGWT